MRARTWLVQRIRWAVLSLLVSLALPGTSLAQQPALSISITHTGNFAQGQRGTYTVIVSNQT